MFYAAVIGVPLAISIFVLLRILFVLRIRKRPISLDKAAEISGIAIAIGPFFFIVGLSIVGLVLSPLVTLVWILGWFPSAFQGAPTFFGTPVYVWFGAVMFFLYVAMLNAWLGLRKTKAPNERIVR